MDQGHLPAPRHSREAGRGGQIRGGHGFPGPVLRATGARVVENQHPEAEDILARVEIGGGTFLDMMERSQEDIAEMRQALAA